MHSNSKSFAIAMSLEMTKRRVYTVSRLNQEVQSALESGFGMLWLQGELSNFSRPASGHFYFSLKDSRSQIRCAMFRGKNRYINFEPQSGDEVLVRGKLGLYSARGDFQLIVEHMEPAGAGKLQAQFEATKKKLQELGWFSQETKKHLPPMPQRIGVITSSTGAAIRDVLQVLARRCPQAEIIVYPTLVQGAQAAPKIAEAINTAGRRNEVDVLLLVRGGGSIEDLWAFNEETVAKAVYECELPIVSGVGHEIDVTIADLVADLRAPTPSAAAELATPDDDTMAQRVASAQYTLFQLISTNVERQKTALHSLLARLEMRHPRRLLQDRSQRIDELDERLQLAMRLQIRQHRLQLAQLSTRLHAHSPSQRLINLRTNLLSIQLRLNSSIQNKVSSAANRWKIAARALDTVSPLATLERGFAVVKHKDKVITDASILAPGDQINTQVARGIIHSKIDSIETNEDESAKIDEN